MTDVIVIGSGPCSANAAYPLVKAGMRVTMLDVGNRDSHYSRLIPDQSFLDIRNTDNAQHRYFLGDNLEGVTLGEARVGAQLTPPRMHITADTDRLLNVDSDDFQPMESLALGGLGAGWGAGAFPFTEYDHRSIPGLYSELLPHYQAVSERIGVTGDCDNLAESFGELNNLLPPLSVDANATTVLNNYRRLRDSMSAEGFRMGQTWLAVCSKRHQGRGPHKYQDMDFWKEDDSVYRPKWTVEELQKYENFEYNQRRFVLSFAETDGGGVQVSARNLDNGKIETYQAAYLIIAAGTLSTARIVLRSLDRYETRVPVLCNPYSYVPVINLGMIGRKPVDERYSLAQLTAIYELPNEQRGPIQAQYFSYRSLLTFKLLKEMPLPFPEATRLTRALIPVIGIVAINYDDAPHPDRYCVLHRVDGAEADRLEIRGGLTDAEKKLQARYDRTVIKFFRRLGCIPIKRIVLPQGSSIHYAGTIPMTVDEQELTCDPQCRLRGTQNVYIADGAVLPYLPAKGLTFTTMANADRVASTILKLVRK